MIKIVRKTTVPVPDILLNKGVNATNNLIARYNNGERTFTKDDFDGKIYGHEDVKNTLIDVQEGKCCFCESKITHISYGDVEHYRPKAAWVQDNEALNKPGYYWLSYNWDNLLLSCQMCNQRHKKNLFPVRNTANRALSHTDDISNEEPLFVHPVIDDPSTLISFNQEIPVSVDGNDRGAMTISRLGLDREALNEQRRSVLNPIRDLYDLARGIPDTTPELKRSAKNVITRYYEDSLKDGTEYAAMRRSFFLQNPIDF